MHELTERQESKKKIEKKTKNKSTKKGKTDFKQVKSIPIFEKDGMTIKKLFVTIIASLKSDAPFKNIFSKIIINI